MAGAAAEAGEPEIEEIVLTGSLIRRDNFDLSSPVEVITDAEIEETGTVSLGDVLVLMAAQSGVSPGETSPFSFGNLRGLGPGATMELMDGHRLLFGDANATYPQIAIERIEILTDSASALYGSEAVAGVINYIPRHRADGFELRIDSTVVEGIFDSPDSKYGVLGGWSSDATDVVFAHEYRERQEIRQTHPRFSRYIDSRVQRIGPDARGRPNLSVPGRTRTTPVHSTCQSVTQRPASPPLWETASRGPQPGRTPSASSISTVAAVTSDSRTPGETVWSPATARANRTLSIT